MIYQRIESNDESEFRQWWKITFFLAATLALVERTLLTQTSLSSSQIERIFQEWFSEIDARFEPWLRRACQLVMICLEENTIFLFFLPHLTRSGFPDNSSLIAPNLDLKTRIHHKSMTAYCRLSLELEISLSETLCKWDTGIMIVSFHAKVSTKMPWRNYGMKKPWWISKIGERQKLARTGIYSGRPCNRAIFGSWTLKNQRWGCGDKLFQTVFLIMCFGQKVRSHPNKPRWFQQVFWLKRSNDW